MALSRAEALECLELPVGADPDSIRTSYKRLAQKWHPDKHKNTAGASDKFRSVALAFKRLACDNEYSTINDIDMYDMYNRVVQQRCTVYSNGYSSSEDASDSDSEDDLINQIIRSSKHNQRLKQDGLNNNNHHHRHTRLTAEEIEQNAKELISSEEREKKKAEKRRAKKKRQREKKRQEKEGKESDNKKSKEQNGLPNSQKAKTRVMHSSGSEEEGFDLTAAFFTEVKSKKKKGGIGELSVHPRPKPAEGVKVNGATEEKSDENLDPVTLRSRQLAIQGNQMASLGNYTAAIDLFTNAIKLDPKDFRFFGNRSYCFDRVQQYDRALKDAEKAINLASEWPKGYFRKGRALAGLKLFPDAEQAFMQVLKLDKNCEDATTELVRVRTHQLTEMGFTLQQAENAIKQYGSVQMALDSLLAGLVGENSLANEIYESDDEDYSNLHPQVIPTRPPTTARPAPPTPLHTATTTIGASSHYSSSQQAYPAATPATITTTSNSGAPTLTSVTLAHMQPITRNAASRASDIKMDPCNPEGLTALWVGNVLPEITQTRLLQMFQKYGTVTSIRMLPEKYCAFVNFKTKEAAGQAMHGLQDQDCGGQRLLIKFPDNPLTTGSVVLRKGAPTANPVKNTSTNTTIISKKSAPAAAASNSQSSLSEAQKASGPINGNECYFWRTTGCQFGDTCRYKHHPSTEGIDKKPWQLSKEK